MSSKKLLANIEGQEIGGHFRKEEAPKLRPLGGYVEYVKDMHIHGSLNRHRSKNLGTTIWQILIMIIDLGETSQDDKSSGQV